MSNMELPALKKGQRVEVFYRTTPEMHGWVPALESSFCFLSPRAGFTDGWTQAEVTQDWDPARFDYRSGETWIKVRFLHRFWFNRCNESLDMQTDVRESHTTFPAAQVRIPGTATKPKVSFIVFRWGGHGKVEAVIEGDGGWGQTGSVASDTYINYFFQQGVQRRLGQEFECLTCYVANSESLRKLQTMAPLLKSQLSGEHIAALYFLWPVEWEDAGDPRYAGYVQRDALLGCMSAFEMAGVPCRFPHSMNLYNVLGAKDWACHLGIFPGLQVPVTTKVPRVHVLQNSRQAAADALAALRQLKSAKLHLSGGSQTSADVTSGVVKLGWSWEATDVWKWNNPEELEHQLKVAMTQVCNHSATCFVQEWVEMDFEMRLFAVNSKADIAPGEVIQPAYYIYNRWNKIDAEGKPREFEKLNRERVLRDVWVGDEAAVRMAERKTAEVMTNLLIWLRGEHAEPPVVMRFDFMVKRVAPGQVVVNTGEMTELGACMLGWKEGPDVLWKAVIDSVMRPGTGSTAKQLTNGINGK